MKKVLKIIQIAAFESNIGDNANISGMRSVFESVFESFAVEWTNLDLADFSWNLNVYDSGFLEQINAHDLLIIGGGGFFELIPGTESWTGTRVNIPKTLFDAFTVPVVFYAIGIDTVRADLVGDSCEIELAKLKQFIYYVESKDNFYLSTRHDGSMAVLKDLLGEEYANQFTLIGDGGFFTTKKDFFHPEIKPNAINIGINFGGDLMEARFPPPNNHADISMDSNVTPADYEAYRHDEQNGFSNFLVSFSDFCKQVVEKYEQVNFIFIPHIYRDLEVAYQFISAIGFPYSRRNIKVAPYLSGFDGKDYIVDLYSKLDLSIGMRLHSNICPIAVGTPSIGLETFPMTRYLYQGLELPERTIRAYNNSKLVDELLALTMASIEHPQAIKNSYEKVRTGIHKKTVDFWGRILHEQYGNY